MKMRSTEAVDNAHRVPGTLAPSEPLRGLSSSSESHSEAETVFNSAFEKANTQRGIWKLAHGSGPAGCMVLAKLLCLLLQSGQRKWGARA